MVAMKWFHYFHSYLLCAIQYYLQLSLWHQSYKCTQWGSLCGYTWSVPFFFGIFSFQICSFVNARNSLIWLHSEFITLNLNYIKGGSLIRLLSSNVLYLWWIAAYSLICIRQLSTHLKYTSGNIDIYYYLSFGLI